MQIKVIKNKTEWEEFIQANSAVSFFQSWNWGEIIRKSNNGKLKFLDRLGLYDNKNRLLAVFGPLKIMALRGTFIHVRHGPVFKEIKYDTVRYLKEYFIFYAKKNHAQFVRISPLIVPSPDNIKMFASLGFINAPIHRMDGEYCWILDLDKTADQLLAGMRKTTRYLIRQAQKLNVEIKKSTSSEDINDFLKLYGLTAQRHGFVEHTGIKEEFEFMVRDNSALLFKGYYDKKLLSGALIIFYGPQAIYHHSASIAQKIPVNYLLQWEAILEAKKRGAKIYNFWGIAAPGQVRHPWQNLTMFKMGFGGRNVEYMHVQDLPVNKISYLKTYLIEFTRKIIKGY